MNDESLGKMNWEFFKKVVLSNPNCNQTINCNKRTWEGSYGKIPPCDFNENRYTYRSLHAEQKSPWTQSRRTHRLTYRGHRKSHLSFSLEIHVCSINTCFE